MESRPSQARLFVALDLPERAREALAAWRAGALDDPGLRLVPPEALHVTLAFLGHLPEDEIARIVSLIEPPALEPPVLTALGVKPVPPRRPRLFALDLADDGDRATAVQASVAGALARAGLYEPEQRPFWPHVTLARVRKGARVRVADAPPPPAEPWRVPALTLYRSRLSRAGAHYEALRRWTWPETQLTD